MYFLNAANDLFRKDSDSFFIEKSSYNASVNVDSLFFKDSNSDSDEELDPDLQEEISEESGPFVSEEVSLDDNVEEVSSNPVTNSSNAGPFAGVEIVASSSTSIPENTPVPSGTTFS